MEIKLVDIKCKSFNRPGFIDREYKVALANLVQGSSEYNKIYEEAEKLANQVNPYAANDPAAARDNQRLIQDAIGGLIAEQAWLQFINEHFGVIASPTKFISATGQIDIKLNNGETAEIRSSFPRNGVGFGICSNKFNFKNIGPYHSSVKPGEIQKNLYLGVLFETQKSELLTVDEIKLALVGGSTWEMMLHKGTAAPLIPEGGHIQERATYRVIRYADALDASEILTQIENLGYSPI